MANQLVLLKYNFMFDATETWQHLFQFEQDLADFFGSFGLEAQVLNSIEGAPTERVMLIKKVEGIDAKISEIPKPEEKETMHSPSETIKVLKKDLKKGK